MSIGRKEALRERYAGVRAATAEICAPLAIEDHVVQAFDDASPAKWHLAHTTWFFETFVLDRASPSRTAFDPAYRYLFNSYYEAVGERHPRGQRGLLARPTVEEVRRYRASIDAEMEASFDRFDDVTLGALELGLHHEQQHQELLVTDLLALFALNPIRPAYRARTRAIENAPSQPLRWHAYEGGIEQIGWGADEFSFDNERPRHRVLVSPFALASRLATNEDYVAFIADRGYERPELWLSDGWAAARSNAWEAPAYWRRRDGAWSVTTLAGEHAIELAAPVEHLSFYEADAFARWSGARLPTEVEWEIAAARAPIEGTFLESMSLTSRPAASGSSAHPGQLFGDVWEWTASPYVAYPGFRALEGALGEYNGKFMCNQLVLRGGSCATPRSHVRATYRNFFPPSARWQFTGLRLARDA